jgi:hypothetical protein
MTNVSNALRVAGVKTPTVKARIWNWLRDHPEKTSDDIQKALGLGYPPAQTLVDMERGGVIKAYSDVSRKQGLKGVEYRIKRYSVVNKDEYIEPVRKAMKPRPLRTVTAEDFVNSPSQYKERVRIKAAPTPLVKPVTAEFNPETWVTGLSLQQAKKLYVYLHGVFK